MPTTVPLERRQSDTIHAASPYSNQRVLELAGKVTAIEADMRTMRSEMLVLKAQPRLSYIVRQARQIRVDYNTERELNSTLSNRIAQLESQLGAQREAIQFQRARLEHVEESQITGVGHIALQRTLAPLEPTMGTIDVNRHREELQGPSSSESSSDADASSSDSESSYTSSSEFTSSYSEHASSDDERHRISERKSAYLVESSTPEEPLPLIKSITKEIPVPYERDIAPSYAAYPHNNQTCEPDCLRFLTPAQQLHQEQFTEQCAQQEVLTRARSGQLNRSETSLSRPWRQRYVPPHLRRKVHLRARQYKVYADFGFRRHRLSRILSALDTVASGNFVQKSEIPPGTPIIHGPVPEVSDHHGRIASFGMTEMTVHLGQMCTKVLCVICERLPAPMVLGHDFCTRYIEAIHPRTKTVELDDSTTVPLVRRPIKCAKGAAPLPPCLEYGKAHGRTSPKLRLVEPVTLRPHSLTWVTVQSDRHGLHILQPLEALRRRSALVAMNGVVRVAPQQPFRILIANCADHPQRIQKSQFVGTLKPHPSALIVSHHRLIEVLQSAFEAEDLHQEYSSKEVARSVQTSATDYRSVDLLKRIAADEVDLGQRSSTTKERLRAALRGIARMWDGSRRQGDEAHFKRKSRNPPSPVLLVRTPGRTWSFCVDYRLAGGHSCPQYMACLTDRRTTAPMCTTKTASQSKYSALHALNKANASHIFLALIRAPPVYKTESDQSSQM